MKEIRKNTSLIINILKDQNYPSNVSSSQDDLIQSGLKMSGSLRKTVEKQKAWPSHRVYEGSGYRKVVVEASVER